MPSNEETPSIARRAIVVAGAVAATSETAFRFVYDQLTTAQEKVDLLHLFPAFPEQQIVPGSHHPSLGFHPDVEEALIGLVKLSNAFGRPEARPFDSLPEPALDEHLLLVGGPISNQFSCSIHGHTFIGDKISPLPSGRAGFRWHFHYPERSKHDLPNGRYIGGAHRLTMPKEIIDTHAPNAHRRIFSECRDDGLISNDYLLITVQPNPRRPSKTILEIADLNGQGDKVFSTLLGDYAFRKEIHGAVRNSRCYQVLCEVSVTHNISELKTRPGKAKVVGIARLA